VLSGDKQTGISLIYMTKELDAGDVIYQQAMPIDLKETYRTLYDKLSHLAYVILKNKIYDLFEPNVPCVPQKQKGITIARNISRADEKIK
jgi:methionyl-tRNA formyltransferase